MAPNCERTMLTSVPVAAAGAGAVGGRSGGCAPQPASSPMRAAAPAGRRGAGSLCRVVAPSGGDELVCGAGRERVDGVVEEVDRDFLATPEDEWRRDVEGGERDGGAAPYGGAVRGGRLGGWHPGRAEDAAHDAPAGAVTPVREVAEARPREVVLELRDAERLRGGPRGGGRRGAVAELRLDRARDRHRRGAEDAGDEPVADRGRGLRQGLHAVTSIAVGEATAAPRRSIRWSPTRMAFAMAVNAGFTALADGKKLVSTTYRLSTSCARQFTSSADVCGSVPNRTVPHWSATPASGMRWSSTDQLGTIVSQPMCPISPLSFWSRRLCGSVLWSTLARWMRPWRSTVTRLEGCGRSSVVSQKSIACLARKSSARPGANHGAPPRRMLRSLLPSIWMWPSGYSKSSAPQ